MPATYYEAWEKAGALYWGEPKDPDGAIGLLAAACDGLKDLQDVSCYNWGVLLELEGRLDAAASAYARAAALSKQAAYVEGARALDQQPEPGDTPYLAAMRYVTRACRQGTEIDAALARVGSLAAPFQPTREAMAQPFFAACLKDKPAYVSLLARLPKAGKSMDGAWHRARASHHPFSSLFDVELFNRGLLINGESRHGITRAWQRTLRAGAQGDGPGCASALSEYFTLLRAAGGDPKTRALRRAAAVLVNSDEFFAKVRAQPVVQEVVQKELKDL